MTSAPRFLSLAANPEDWSRARVIRILLPETEVLSIVALENKSLKFKG
jgi:hypothetical protein